MQTESIEDTIQQLKAVIAKDPAGFASDDAARALFEKLNEEIAKMHFEEGDDDEEDDGDDGVDEEVDEEYTDDEGDDDRGAGGDGAGGRRAGSVSGGPRVELPKGPRPYDLWKAAHELDRPAKEVGTINRSIDGWTIGSAAGNRSDRVLQRLEQLAGRQRLAGTSQQASTYQQQHGGSCQRRREYTSGAQCWTAGPADKPGACIDAGAA